MSAEITALPKTTNPYWDEAKEAIEAKDKLGIKEYLKKYGDHKGLRGKLVCKYSWAVPDPASLAFVARHIGGKAIEIGAGTGYWAWQLSQLGVNILAYDKAPPDSVPNEYHCISDEDEVFKELIPTWYGVLQGGPGMLHRHPDRTLLLCWPPPMISMAAQCLEAYQGNRFVFIGDYKCCGNYLFFELLDEDWAVVETHRIAQWREIGDVIVVYERSEKQGGHDE